MITALLEGHSHVPYRESKLTRLLQQSLGGSHKTCIIANVTEANHESMLEFATRAKQVRNKPIINSVVRARAYVRQLVNEVEHLKQQLQFAREKSGVYIPAEQWSSVQQEHAETKKRLEDVENDLSTRVTQLEQLHSKFEQTQAMLSDKSERLSSTEAILLETADNLQSTRVALAQTENTLDEKREIIQVREAVEDVLHSNATEILGVLETRDDEVERMHEKMARVNATKAENEERAQRTRAHVSDAVCALSLIHI